MKLKHVKTLPLDTEIRLFFTIENDSETKFSGDLLLELRNFLGLPIMNFDLTTRVIDAKSFGSFFIDVPKKTAKWFSSFKFIFHRQNENEGLVVFDGKGYRLNN